MLAEGPEIGGCIRNRRPFEVHFFSESILEKQGDRNIRRVVGFNDDRCFISFFGIENFIAKIDTYENHQMKRARQTDRSLESLGNLQKLGKNTLVMPEGKKYWGC